MDHEPGQHEVWHTIHAALDAQADLLHLALNLRRTVLVLFARRVRGRQGRNRSGARVHAPGLCRVLRRATVGSDRCRTRQHNSSADGV
jgi:hypothetical protein